MTKAKAPIKHNEYSTSGLTQKRTVINKAQSDERELENKRFDQEIECYLKYRLWKHRHVKSREEKKELYLKSYWILNEWRVRVEQTPMHSDWIKCYFIKNQPNHITAIVLNEISRFITDEWIDWYPFQNAVAWTPPKLRNKQEDKTELELLSEMLREAPEIYVFLENISLKAQRHYSKYWEALADAFNRLKKHEARVPIRSDQTTRTGHLDRMVSNLDHVYKEHFKRRKVNSSERLELFAPLIAMFEDLDVERTSSEALRTRLRRFNHHYIDKNQLAVYLNFIKEEER